MCDAVFDQQDAEVVCRELDCGVPVQVLGAAAFDKGDTKMWTQEIQCGGNESEIHLCPTSPSHENCSQNNNVMLVCAGKSWIKRERERQLFMCVYNTVVHYFKYD